MAVLKSKDESMMAAGQELYEQLRAAGIDVMLDDRKMSPGAKMKDLELLGFPYVVIVGRDFATEGKVEFRTRRTMETVKVDAGEVAGLLTERLPTERKGLV